MINIISLSLLLSSLVAAGVFSPPPVPNPIPNPVLREGHRLIVVEFEREVPPPSSPSPPPPVEIAEDDDGPSIIPHPSKDKISSLVSKTKHKLAQFEESGSEAVASVAGMVKDAAEDTASNISAVAKKAEETAEELRGNLTDILLRARDLGRDFAAHVCVTAAGATRSAVAVLHLLGFGIAFGTCVWVTFLSGHVLASSLARQQFAAVQSRMYPVYFRAVGLGVAAAAAAVFVWSRERDAAERTQGYNLLGVLGMVMVNMLLLEPKTTKAMFERMKLEKEDGWGAEVLNAGTEPVPAAPHPASIGPGKKAAVAKSQIAQASGRLRRLNSYSSLLNVLSLMALCWHLVHLARRLESSC